MATSSMAIDTTVIEELADDESVNASNLDGNFDEVVDKFNSSLETSTGHNHDGTNSRAVLVSGTGLNAIELLRAQLMGSFQ